MSQSPINYTRTFVSIFDQNEYDCPDVEVHSYSGRGMYGKQCIAITGQPNEIEKAINLAITMYVDEAKDLIEVGTHKNNKDTVQLGIDILDNFNSFLMPLQRRCTDSMGLDQVVYFPLLEWDQTFES